MPDRKPILVCTTPLPVAAALGDPDRHISGHRGEGLGRAGSDAEGIVVVFFGQLVLNALHFGAPTRPAFDRKTGSFKLIIEPPPCGIHGGRIFERRFNLALNPFEAGGFPLRALLLLGTVLARAGPRILPDALPPPLVVGEKVGE